MSQVSTPPPRPSPPIHVLVSGFLSRRGCGIPADAHRWSSNFANSRVRSFSDSRHRNMPHGLSYDDRSTITWYCCTNLLCRSAGVFSKLLPFTHGYLLLTTDTLSGALDLAKKYPARSSFQRTHGSARLPPREITAKIMRNEPGQVQMLPPDSSTGMEGGRRKARFGDLEIGAARITPHLRWKLPNRNKQTSKNPPHLFYSSSIVDCRSFIMCHACHVC